MIPKSDGVSAEFCQGKVCAAQGSLTCEGLWHNELLCVYVRLICSSTGSYYDLSYDYNDDDDMEEDDDYRKNNTNASHR